MTDDKMKRLLLKANPEELLRTELEAAETEALEQREKRLDATRAMKKNFEQNEQERQELANKAEKEWSQKQAEWIQKENDANRDLRSFIEELNEKDDNQ